MPSLWTIPNILTVARVAAAPGVALAFALLPRPLADTVALVVFVTAALTDFLDGWLARKLNQISAFGRMLDPVADKAMVTIALAVLAALHGTQPLLLVPVAAILLRETLVAGLREYLKGAAVLSVTPLAKWKTTTQLAAIAVLLAAVPLAGVGVPVGLTNALGLVLLWLAAVLTVITGWDYAVKALPTLRA